MEKKLDNILKLHVKGCQSETYFKTLDNILKLYVKGCQSETYFKTF